jgi:hypothetical protein
MPVWRRHTLKTFSFEQQLAAGNVGERLLDEFFSAQGRLDRATIAQQHDGIDRILTKSDGRRYAIEYKTDFRAEETDRVFIETKSDRDHNSTGGPAKSLAQLLVILLPNRQWAWLIPMAEVKHALPKWLGRYPIKQVQNRDWVTQGIAVPLAEIEQLNGCIVCYTGNTEEGEGKL